MMKFHCISNDFVATNFSAVSTDYVALFQRAFTCPMSTSK